jgi:hypothetical protein
MELVMSSLIGGKKDFGRETGSVRFGHRLDETLEDRLGFPTELLFGLGIVTDQKINLDGAVVARSISIYCFQSRSRRAKATSRHSRMVWVALLATT